MSKFNQEKKFTFRVTKEEIEKAIELGMTPEEFAEQIWKEMKPLYEEAETQRNVELISQYILSKK